MAEQKSEKKLGTTVATIFEGMDKFMSSKTVVGEVVHINDKIIVPLIDVSFGAGAGAYEKSDKNSAGGGIGGKMSPSSVLVISKDGIKMVPVNQPQDTLSRIIDLVRDVINKFTKSDSDDELDEDVEETIDELKNK